VLVGDNKRTLKRGFDWRASKTVREERGGATGEERGELGGWSRRYA